MVRLRHALMLGGIVSAHAIADFARESFVMYGYEMTSKAEMARWLNQYGWLFMAGVLVAMLGLQLWIDLPKLRARA